MSKTTYDKNLEELEPVETPKGVRLDLRLYVYPDGHGNIYVEREGKVYQNYPARSKETASDVFADIWNRASELSGKPDNHRETGDLSPELVAWLDNLGIKPRPSIGALALQKMLHHRDASSTEMSDAIIAARDE